MIKKLRQEIETKRLDSWPKVLYNDFRRYVGRFFLSFVIIFFSLCWIIAMIRVYQQNEVFRARLEEVYEHLQKVLVKNRRLNQEINALKSDPIHIERVLRDMDVILDRQGE